MITNDAKCTRELNPGLPWEKQYSTSITHSQGGEEYPTYSREKEG
jgi:hypothetical protein